MAIQGQAQIGTTKRVNHDRNAEIVTAYLSGDMITAIAKRHGLSPSRVSVIIGKSGKRLVGDAWFNRHSAQKRRDWTRPEFRAAVADGWRRRNGVAAARSKIFADDPDKREEYLLLRSVYGSAYARQMMGLP